MRRKKLTVTNQSPAVYDSGIATSHSTDLPGRWIADGDKSISPPVTPHRHAPAIRPAFSVRLSSVCIKYHAAPSAGGAEVPVM